MHALDFPQAAVLPPALGVLQRNRLAWLHPAAWQSILARPWDSQARSVLAHWHSRALPLVLCTHRNPSSPQAISLGLPAPTQWHRRKLALEVAASDIARVGDFPAPQCAAPLAFAAPHAQAFLQRMQALQVPLQVYGSYGWQWLTGLDYVRSNSDIDLIARVDSLARARAVARALQALQLPMRVDGELALPGGQALAWREFLQWDAGHSAQLLLKSRSQVQLVERLPLPEPETACSA